LGASALRMAGDLSDIAGATGIAAGQLQNFKTSIIEAGGKADDFSQIASKLNQSVQEAAGGNSKLQQAFRDLGIFVTDSNGKIRNTGDILGDLTAKFQSGEISGKEYAAAIDILGKNVNKLELGKLNALKDPIADAEIKKLDDYNEAIDRIRAKLEKGVVSFFGQLALDIEKTMKAHDDLEKKLNAQGKGQIAPALTSSVRSMLGMEPRTTEPFFTRQLSAEEKAFNEQQKLYKEQEKLMSGYKSRAGVTAPEGGFGATPPEVVKAQEASAKRIEQSKIEIARAGALTRNTDELTIRTQGAEKLSALSSKQEADLAALKINLDNDIAKQRIDIYAQENLDKTKKEEEFNQKKLELTAKSAEAEAKIRQQYARDVDAENKRILDIVESSKQYTRELEGQTKLAERRGQLMIDGATMTDRERKNAEALLRVEEERLKALEKIALIKDLPADERLAREKQINEQFAKRKTITENQQAADRALSENFSAGWQRAYSQYAEDSRNNFENAGRIFQSVTKNMEDALVAFAKTGKWEWRNYANAVLDEILRIQIRQLAASAISGINSGGSLILNGLSALTGRASGGPVTGGTPYIVGERGPELFVPNGSGSITPNNQLGGTSVVYNINAVDAPSFKQMIASDPTFLYAVTEQGRRRLPGGR
jgi:lambda family phage tail tape measure protein